MADDKWEKEITLAAKRVYSSLGPSLPENLYRNAMITALGCGLSRAVAINVYFDDVLTGTVEADLVDASRDYLIECKTIINEPVAEGKEAGQARAYMRHTGITKGAVINFGWTRGEPDILFIYKEDK